MTASSSPAECAICWSLVPRHLMHFQREWHAADEQRSPYAAAVAAPGPAADERPAV